MKLLISILVFSDLILAGLGRVRLVRAEEEWESSTPLSLSWQRSQWGCIFPGGFGQSQDRHHLKVFCFAEFPFLFLYLDKMGVFLSVPVNISIVFFTLSSSLDHCRIYYVKSHQCLVPQNLGFLEGWPPPFPWDAIGQT